jgi:glucose-6-phosphate 1-dehydrogenase
LVFLDTLQGKAVGYVFNQHVSSLVFWEQLERIVQTTLDPSRVVQVYKANTWSQAPEADLERIIRETDYALVGVGA